MTAAYNNREIVSLPGPAVTATTPTTPDNLATASAANTAVTWVQNDGVKNHLRGLSSSQPNII